MRADPGASSRRCQRGCRLRRPWPAVGAAWVCSDQEGVGGVRRPTPERAAAILEQFLGHPVRRVDDAISVEGENGQSLAAHLIRQLTLANIEVRGVNVTAPTLEDVFVHLTGRAIRDELASAKERLGARLRSRGRLRR